MNQDCCLYTICYLSLEKLHQNFQSYKDSLARPLIPQDAETRVESLYDYQSCDINPFVINSNLNFGENFVTILIIIICSCILVAIIIVVAVIIYR